jgi:hypothetical protein
MMVTDKLMYYDLCYLYGEMLQTRLLSQEYLLHRVHNYGSCEYV